MAFLLKTRRASLIVPILAVSILITAFTVKQKNGSFSKTVADSLVTVPLGGNAWRNDKDTSGGNITDKGIVNWSDPKAGFTAYIRFGHTGKLKVYLNLSVPKGTTALTVTALGVTKAITVSGSDFKNAYIGEWLVRDTGYVAFRIKGISKTGDIFADVSAIALSGEPTKNKLNFVRDNEGQFFYWGRRGPSVHLGYVVPENINAEWFYNEVTVPKGNDVLGSYFMAAGFGEGYFGMQVNSPNERHILFSVWSPFNTDDPKSIPDDQKVVLLQKGQNVPAGEFGSEGSGGQSYMNYNWIAGNTYKFLVHARPDGTGRTSYTAYFYAPELGKWQLIAGFSRPKTNTYLKHLHSFLENFDPEQGTKTRKAYFNNEWVCDNTGKWMELTKVRFTGDNTAVKGYRMDYAGGLDGSSFYLKNCGFFNHYTARNIFFTRAAGGKQPDIDLGSLPN